MNLNASVYKYQRNRADKFIENQITVLKSIFGTENIRLATHIEDTKESFDIMVDDNIRVALRVRDESKYFKYAGSDFTIRSQVDGKGDTEFNKLLSDDNQTLFMLYAFVNEDTKAIKSWILIDLMQLRTQLNTYGAEEYRKSHEKANWQNDTKFICLKYSDFPGIVNSSHNITFARG